MTHSLLKPVVFCMNVMKPGEGSCHLFFHQILISSFGTSGFAGLKYLGFKKCCSCVWLLHRWSLLRGHCDCSCDTSHYGTCTSFTLCVQRHTDEMRRRWSGVTETKGPSVPTNASLVPEDAVGRAAGTRPVPLRTFLGPQQEKESDLFSSLDATSDPSSRGPRFHLGLLPPLRFHTGPGTEPGLGPGAPPSLCISTSHLIASELSFSFSWRLVTS